MRRGRRAAAMAALICVMGAAPVYGAETYEAGERITVQTGLEGGYEEMDFTCLDSDYRGGALFLSDEIIPYSLCSRYGAKDNDYTLSDVRTWLNQYFADTLSVSEDILPIKLEETEDSLSDKVFCISLEEAKNAAYREYTKKNWTPSRGKRYYWTRTARENTDNQAYMVQYNGHIASSRVSLTEAGIRPAFVLGKGEEDVSQGNIWYDGDTKEQVIDGKTYTFRCVDPDYCDAEGNRAGALFVCDTILGGDLSLFDDKVNAWEASKLREWLNQAAEDTDGMAEVFTTSRYTYAGKGSDYQMKESRFTKRVRKGAPVSDKLFCLSLEEALRYSDVLWKLEGSEENNFTQAGTYKMGYWLRTPAAGDGTKCYAVTYDGRVMPEDVDNPQIGFRPAFVEKQE